MLVVDASVAIKWFLNEHDSKQAVALFRQPYKLIAPDLIRIEVLSGIAKAVRRNTLEPADAEAKASEWRSFIARRGIYIAHSDADYAQATTLALETKHPLYDCLYLVYAQSFKAPLVTADKRLNELATELKIDIYNFLDI